MRSDFGVSPGGVNQPSELHGSDTDSEYDIDKRGHKHRKDEFGQRVRKSGRPPFIPLAWWSKMSQTKRLQAKLDYAKSKEAVAIVPNRGGASGSGEPYPQPKPAMNCVAGAPMEIYGLLLHCKGVEQVVNTGDETDVPGTDAEDNAFPDDPHADDEDIFDIGAYKPSYRHASEVPAMPSMIRPPQDPHSTSSFRRGRRTVS